VELLNGIPGLHCHRPEGAFYVFPSCASFIGRVRPDGRKLESDEDFVMHLLDVESLAVLHGAAYGVSPFFRISFATSMEVLEEGAHRLRRAVSMLD